MSNPYAHLPYRAGVGLVILDPSGLIFAARRIDTVAEAWQMPQGGIDSGEDVKTAALRELREETGLWPEHVTIEQTLGDWLSYDLPDDLIPTIWKGRFKGQRQKWLKLRLTAPKDVIDINQENPEFSEWKFLTPGEIIERIVPFKRSLYSDVFTAFGL